MKSNKELINANSVNGFSVMRPLYHIVDLGIVKEQIYPSYAGFLFLVGFSHEEYSDFMRRLVLPKSKIQ